MKLKKKLSGISLLGSVLVLAACSKGGQSIPSGMQSHPVTPRNVSYVPPSLHIEREGSQLSVRGSLASSKEREKLVQRLGMIFPGSVDGSSLQVSKDRGPADWLENVLVITQNMAIVDDFSIEISGEDLFLGGNTGSRDAADSFIQDAYALIGGRLIIRDDFGGRSAANNNLPAPVDSDAGGLSDEQEYAADQALLAEQQSDLATPSFNEVPLARLDSNAVDPDRAAELALIDQQRLALIYAEDSSEATGLAAGSQVYLDEPSFAALLPSAPGIVEIPLDRQQQSASSEGCQINANGNCTALNGYLKNVRFYGRSDKLTLRARVTLERLADVLLENPDRNLAVMSYSSNSGAPWEQKDRARLRAKSVVTFLVKEGVELERLQGYALGHVNGSSDQIVIKEK